MQGKVTQQIITLDYSTINPTMIECTIYLHASKLQHRWSETITQLKEVEEADQH